MRGNHFFYARWVETKKKYEVPMLPLVTAVLALAANSLSANRKLKME